MLATVHNRRLKHTSSLPKYHFTVQSSPVKDGHVDPRREGNFGGPLRRERGRSRHARANKVMSAAAICDWAAKAAQTAGFFEG